LATEVGYDHASNARAHLYEFVRLRTRIFLDEHELRDRRVEPIEDRCQRIVQVIEV